jgi:hypothetical protein
VILHDPSRDLVSIGATRANAFASNSASVDQCQVRITAANDVTVTFAGTDNKGGGLRTSISGSINHVTGDVWATNMLANTRPIPRPNTTRSTTRSNAGASSGCSNSSGRWASRRQMAANILTRDEAGRNRR